MAFTDLPLFNVLRENMSFLSQRQQVLAENIANADTPGFRAMDIERPDFHAMLQQSMSTGGLTRGSFDITDSPDSFSGPNGNTVVLEDQMMRVAETQMDHQAAIGVYEKSLSILRMAVRGAR